MTRPCSTSTPSGRCSPVGTYGRPPSPLRLTIMGPGLREVRQIRATYTDNLPFSVPVDPPDEAVMTTICVRNEGIRRSRSTAAPTGRRARRRASTASRSARRTSRSFFAEARRHSLLARLPLAIERMQAFKPDAPWLAWLVAVLFVIGMPLLVVWAYATGAGSDEDRGASPRVPQP